MLKEYQVNSIRSYIILTDHFKMDVLFEKD